MNAPDDRSRLMKKMTSLLPLAALGILGLVAPGPAPPEKGSRPTAASPR